MENTKHVIVELLVRNHPGVMSHITGLFARRAFNLEGILCSRIDVGEKSRMYLLVQRDDNLDQITKQLEKLYDVVNVNVYEEYNENVFDEVQKLIFLQ
ncbi:acetolactate synthase small subunit [Clostridium felsineum]|uniref:Acetolactate synthase small subunit n=1 Tax=Clostridium felsineum TaxID=36839 RepID=A0A1S8LFY5_9CLOT|nr:acetolactate synthase small subunit [Clostridium felsineum]MCR3761815.1 acetolactate synthase small subunit [Clostridium felsineum]URZ02899.1 hypothetical protein CLAUR_029330 [Clostridium felsineum]URZ08762.1 hypothetical protein CLROS_041560 [Clostridium felsineum]URZ09390.1 hypothetical protein CROST_000610 [Clostridium felsineum]URZ14253.1 hypothetical protein CLFE_002380 [Clostridium felsineum DSM 794]